MEDYNNSLYDYYLLEENEYNRRERVRKKRRECPCLFCEGFTHDEFVNVANNNAKKIKRITNVSVHNSIIYCTVKSKTGLSSWEFSVDFNNWGHITGTYWILWNNHDSDIAEIYGNYVSREIQSILSSRSILLKDFAREVESNKLLETETGLCTYYKESVLRRLIKKNTEMVTVGYSYSELIGEHLYPVVSILKNKGFVNYKAIPIKDVGRDSDKFIYQVEQIVIGENNCFQRDDRFYKNEMINILYHDKLEIKFPYSLTRFKRNNCLNIGDTLYEMGFDSIDVREIKDLIIGLIKKDGSVEEIVVDDGTEEPIKMNKRYPYDTKIIIKYHTFK